MTSRFSRRRFLASSLASAVILPGCRKSAAVGGETGAEPLYQISLAEWSLHRAIREQGMDPLDFPVVAARDFGIQAVEYVNQLFMDKGGDQAWLTELKKRADDHGVTSVLIMIDREGNLGEPDEAKRVEAVDNHKKWVEAAKFLGCHAVRVNARSEGSYGEQQERAADGLRRLCEFAAPLGIDVIVENHGGLSSNGQWLAGTIEKVGMENCGTLPDFGNFKIGPDEEYDRYQGVKELMPSARGVSAKSYDFDEAGNETTIDYRKMMEIVVAAGYRGYVGVEYEGLNLPEPDGIKATKALLERVRDELA